MTRPRKIITGALVGIIAIPPLSSVVAQQQQGGLTVSLGYSEQFVSDDDDGDSLNSGIDIGIQSSTRSQTFGLNFGGVLEKDGSGSLGSWEDPRASLSYGISNRSTAFQLGLSHRSVEINRLITLDEDLDGGALVLADGDRDTNRANMSFEFGRDAPFGGTFALTYIETDYSGIGSAGLLDSENTSANLDFRFEIDPQITLTTTFSVSDLDRDGGTDTRTSRAGVGASVTFSETLSGTFNLGFTRTEQSGTVSSEQDGLFYSAGLTQQRPNGTLGGSIQSNINESGRRTSLRVNRSFVLKRGQLNLGAGLSRDEDDGDVDPVYSISYSHELPRGSFTGSFEQDFGNDTAGNERLDSRLGLSLEQDLTAISKLGASINFREISGGGSSNLEQINLGLNYSQSLNADWRLVAGYTHVRRKTGGASTDIDNRLFVGVSTERLWRP